MTGFGKATGEINNKKITVEVKSLNSKQADINVRIPSFYKEKELPLRSLVNKLLERGKIELNLYVELLGEQSSYSINTELFQKYYNELRDLSYSLDDKGKTDLMAIVSKMPDVLKSDRQELDENEWEVIQGVIEKAIANLDGFRTTEGESLENDLSQRIDNIANLLLDVEQFEEQRVASVRERIMSHLKDSVGEENINKDRFEQELIYYLEKFDVSEEKTRLNAHCNYFKETMGGTDSQGKKLGFISQEIGREINTLGSKANHASLQKIVVQMKDELEKIKEQVLNIL